MPNTTMQPPDSASYQILVPDRQVWEPEMFPKQRKFFNCETRFRLASGPRYCGKSRCVYHTILRHAWSTRNARVAIIAKSVRNAKVGVWGDLTTYIWNEWKESGLHSPHSKFDWVKEPGVDGATRMHYFRMKNYYGGVSEIQLHSLDFDGEVASKLMNTSFSMIYFSELQNFSDPDVFKISILQLRMEGLPYSKHLWMSDTNPPDSGPDHFAYKLWYEQRVQSEPPEKCKTEVQIDEFRQYQRQFGLHEFDLNDNIYGDPEMIRDLKNTYADDDQGWQRFILGKWTRAISSKEYHFRTAFKPEIHIIGDVSSPSKDDWQIVKPTHECKELLYGWDLGDSTNNAFVVMEELIMEGDVVGYVIINELVWVGIQEPLVDFVQEAIEMIDKTEALCKPGVEGIHWSDNSAWRFSNKAEEIDAVLLHKMSEGRITLMSAASAKAHQGVRRRIKMVQDLLKQGRLLVSANCKSTIAMFENLKSGRLRPDGTGESILRGSEYKHVFDAISYVLFCQLFEEVSSGPQKPRVEPEGFVSLNL